MEIITNKEAKELGLVRFFTGKPCKHRHTSERYTSNGECCSCDYQRKLSEKEKARNRENYRTNKNGAKVKKAKANVNRAAQENQSIKSLSYAYDLKEAKALGVSIDEYREMMK